MALKVDAIVVHFKNMQVKPPLCFSDMCIFIFCSFDKNRFYNVAVIVECDGFMLITE